MKGKRCAWWCLALASVLVSGTARLRADAPTEPRRLDNWDAELPCISRTLPDMTVVALPPQAPRAQHAFWDRENLYLFGGVAAMRTLDYTSTMNMLHRGREEILLPPDVVRNHAGFAALEAASTATSIGIAYLLHRTGHHRLERLVSIGHISGAGFGDVRNYALKTYHPRK